MAFRQGVTFVVRSPRVAAIEVAREGRDQIARDLWTPRRTPISSGYLCQICAEAVAHVGSIGPSALERALVAHLAPEGIGKLDYGQLRVDDLIGWGGLASRARLAQLAHPAGGIDVCVPVPGPNTRPWEHLPDLTALSEQLRRRLT